MRRVLLSLVFLSIGLLLYAQAPIRFGNREVYLEANVRPMVRGHHTSSLELGLPTAACLNVLVQFEPAKISYEALKQKGVELGDYLGANAYFATVLPGSRPSDFAETGLRTVVPIRAEWKIITSLLEGEMPQWAVEGEKLKVTLSWFKGVTAEQVKADLRERGLSFNAVSDLLRSAEITARREQILALADANYVSAIRWVQPPMELENFRGARLGGAANLRMTPELGGRGLTGKGVRVGIWDGNVADHIDYGNRAHRCEFEIGQASAGGHGMHTTGTILGAGLLDERARGMAPEAEIWTWNFNKQSNGKSVAQEMLECNEKENISITSNSYGLRMSALCGYEKFLNYSQLGNPNTDLLAYYVPTLTHCFSAGNSQGACDKAFSHSTNYAKNIISVAALTATGEMTTFSSFGPLLDGRIFPIISARGRNVYSVMPEQSYDYMSGTSMSCPTVAGHLALLTQRWGQLHGGALPYNYYLKALIANTADDAGNVGPDYKFGFGSLNAIAAVTAMENNWHSFASLGKGGTAQTKTINVPAGVKEFRVMICWNDPVSSKEYATGDCPLVNDLDVTVEGNGKTYLPYTLDPSNPNTPAVATAKNVVDNIEQVVVKDPVAGSYTIKVEGKVNQEEKQDYVVVWYFDHKRPMITAPMNGDTYTPGDDIFLHTENLTAPLKVELTTDGTSYTLLTETASLCDSILLPKTTPASNRASIRVVDAKGYTVKMTGQFSIMTRATDLKLEEQACSTTGWKLTWAAAEGATKYEILRADVDKGVYTVLNDNVTTTEYVLEASAVKEGQRNVYAVRAINGEGVKGARSIAVFAKGASPKTLTIADLPYLESFVGSPLRYATMSAGKNVLYQPVETPASLNLPFDSHVLIWQASKDAQNWDEPFKQHDNVGTLTSCNIDLTDIPKNTKLHLRTYYYMPKSEREKGALLRLLVNGEEKADVLGRGQIECDGEEHYATWDLTPYAGQKIMLKFETALANKKDRIVFVYYRLNKTTETKDAGIAWVNEPAIEAKVSMQNETIRFKVMNFTSSEITNVPVSVQVDGKLIYSTLIETLKPFEDRIIAVEHNFASEAPHKFSVVVRAATEGDTKPANDEETFEVYNMGEGIVMPEVSYVEFWGMKLPKVPYISTKLSGKKLFTDGRGMLEQYNVDEQALLQILPSKNNAAVQVTFKERAFAEGDTLYIFTGNVPANLKVKPSAANYKLTGNSKEPLTYVADATNGGLTFVFVAYSGKQNDGWVAELSEVAMPDQWELTEIQETLGADDNHKKIDITVKNLLPIVLKGVVLNVAIDGVVQRYLIPELKAQGDTHFVLPKEIDVTAPMRMEVEAELAFDGNAANNKKTLSILHDPIWEGGGTIKTPTMLAIAKVRTAIGQEPISIKSGDKVVYMPETKVPLYTKGKNALEFVLTKKVTAETAAASIRVFVDANDDNTLEENATELVKKETLKVDNDTYNLIIDLSGLTGLKPGEHRMRVVLTDDANYTKFKSKEEIAWGHVVDFTTELKEGQSPSDFELALEEFVDLKTGRDNLTNETPIRVKIKNNGLTDVNKLKLAVKVDELNEIEEEMSCSLSARGGTAMLTFNAKADLSAEGKHTVTVSLKDKDGNEKDNVLTATIYKIAPKTSDLYALNFVNAEKEAVKLENIGTKVQDKVTVEGWWKLDDIQTAAFLHSGKKGIYLGSFKGNAKYAPNSLVVIAGDGGYISKKAALKSGKWHHVAAYIELTQTWYGSDDISVKAYVDGESVEMTQIGVGGFSFKHVFLNAMTGQNAMFRIWNKKRTPLELKNAMTKSVREGGNLPAGCIGEYIFTEGKGKISAFGEDGNNYARIVSERQDEDIWKKLDKVLKSVEVEGQIIPAQVTGTDIKVTMPHNFTAFDKVKVNFITHWPEVTIKNGAMEIANGAQIDFSTATDNKLTFTLERQNLFGVNLSEQVSIQIVKDASDACDLLTIALPKEKNAGLKTGLTVTNPEQLIVFEAGDNSATEKFNPKEAVLVVSSISQGAKLYNGNSEVALNSDLKVDLSSPLTLRVVAQNNRDAKFYTVRLALKQEIEWAADKIERVYQGDPLKLDATVSSGLPISYLSLDPTIVTVDADGNLITVGVGTTQIIAKQEGDDLYKAAEAKSRDIEVTRANLTIKVKDVTMAQGDELPALEFEYQGLAFPNTEAQFETTYEIYMPNGKVWDATMPPLPQGTYTIAPKGYTQPYEQGCYKVTRTNATLTVTPAKEAKEVTFVTKNEANEILPSVTLQIGKMAVETTTEGTYKLYLRAGTYSVTATKAGYTTATKDFEVKEGSVTVELQLLQEVYTLTYLADVNGIVQGSSVQKVAAGCNGTQVVALPKMQKYRFKKWSDGNSEAVRMDKAVTKDITVTAEFETFNYSLVYNVSEGGEFLDPTKATQQVVPGEDGQQVAVKAKEGYMFIGWSDGVMTKERKELRVRKDMTIKAMFFKPYRLAWTENFNLGESALKGWTIEKPKAGLGWHISEFNQIVTNANSGNKLILAPQYEASKPIYESLSAASPWFSLEARGTSKVVLTYIRYINVTYLRPVAKLEYSFEDEVWKPAADISDTPIGAKTETFELDNATLGTHKYIRFRWIFGGGATATYCALDDIRVCYDPEPGHVMLRYLAGEHGKLQKQGETDKVERLEFTTTAGTEGAEVTAVSDAGYVFDKWSDEKMEAVRKDKQEVTVMALFKPTPKPTYVIQYLAGANGTVTGLKYQIVEEGAETTSVAAVPNAGYVFKQWNDGRTDNPRTDVVGTEDKIYTAEFAKTYTLTYIAEEHGKILGKAEQVVLEGENGEEVEAKANAGYHFVKWSDEKMETKRTDLAVMADATYKALFEADAPQPKLFAVTLAHEGEGTLVIIDYDAEKLKAVPEGTELTAVATPTKGWKLKSLMAGAQDIVADGKFTVTADVEVKAVFVEEGAPQPKTYVVTVAKEGEGELKITGIEESKLNAVPEGTELMAVTTPKTGWKLKSLMAGTQDIKADGKFTVIADVEVKAVFVEEGAPQPNTYVVTVAKEGEGELKITGIEESKLNAVPEDTELTAVAIPKTGWKLESLKAGDTDISSDGKFTVTADVEVKAVFVKTTSVEDAVLANVLVAPNPFTTQLRLLCNGATGRYDLLNAQGVVVRSGNMAGSEIVIETSDLTSGLYLLRLTTENGAVKTITVVKER